VEEGLIYLHGRHTVCDGMEPDKKNFFSVDYFLSSFYSVRSASLNSFLAANFPQAGHIQP
jgi:hypothetical protein